MLKKISSVVLAIVLMLSVFPCTVSALDAEPGFSLKSGEPTLVNSSGNAESKSWQFLSRYVDIDQFREHLIEGVSNCETEIDISAFKIPYVQEGMDAICDYLWYCVPEAFNFETAESSGYYDPYPTAYFKTLKPGYRDFADVAQEYDACYTKMVTVANKILDGIEDNEAFDDVQKALLLHDRLALWNEYDYDGLKTKDVKIYTAYGALGEGKSVCQGYAMAYMYLLNRVGIDNYYCSSEKLNHGWNIVYIDGKPYHVDVTWDDISWCEGERSVVGGVEHDNFLRSNEGIYDTKHTADDYDMSAVYTTYDDYFWRESSAVFELIDGEIYYIDNLKQQLKRYSDKSVLCAVEDNWRYYIDENRYYDFGNNARLSSNGEVLFYSLTDGVYQYDILTGDVTQVYEANLSGDFGIYGMIYEDGYLICDINDIKPNTSLGCENLYQIKVKYEKPAPVPESIEIASLPIKTEYLKGEQLDINGLVINLVYSDNTKETITNGFTVSGFESDTIGEKTVTVTYGDFSTEFIVTVKEYEYVGIGDIDGSGKIDNRDLVMLIRYINGWNVTVNLEEADVYEDNVINNKDYVVLLRYINNWMA